MKPMVDSGAAIHVCPSWYGFSSLCVSAKQLSQKCGDVLHHLGSEVESYVYQNLKLQENSEVAPVVTSKGVLVVFGVEENSSFNQLLDGHKNSHDQRKWC